MIDDDVPPLSNTGRNCPECTEPMVSVHVDSLPALIICPMCGATVFEVSTPSLVEPGTNRLTAYAHNAIEHNLRSGSKRSN